MRSEFLAAGVLVAAGLIAALQVALVRAPIGLPENVKTSGGARVLGYRLQPHEGEPPQAVDLTLVVNGPARDDAGGQPLVYLVKAGDGTVDSVHPAGLSLATAASHEEKLLLMPKVGAGPWKVQARSGPAFGLFSVDP